MFALSTTVTDGYPPKRWVTVQTLDATSKHWEYVPDPVIISSKSKTVQTVVGVSGQVTLALRFTVANGL